MKLYKFTKDPKAIVHPEEFDASVTGKIKWLGDGYVSMDDGWKDLMVSLNKDTFTLCDADDVVAAKALSKPFWDGMKRARIREKYTTDDEFRALRVDDTTIKNAIAAIITSINAERDAFYAIS
ncbi:MAG: hypothetical protein CMC98_02100 [Flavobacteriales bacterium]|nr:hypothetical protein [Flavobacteriales bacterium]|tara:strand:- start:1813 stop:2181 length:369 start_codon:yes stop_codon:yes gene_type:complete